jgi:hypothetical protein
MASLPRRPDWNMGPLVIAAIAPALVLVLFAARGWLNLDHLVMLVGLLLVTFAPSYVFADFLLSLFRPGGGEPR